MATPDVHRIDHPVVFVHETDKAWDRDRIDYERDVLAGKRAAEPGRPVPFPSWEDHPWHRFVTGKSRGDLSTVSEYLAGEADRFCFRRMPLSVWRVFNELGGVGSYSARVFAASNTLERIEGPRGFELDGGKSGEPLTERDMERIWDTFGDAVLDALGYWAYAASRRLTESEKKL